VGVRGVSVAGAAVMPSLLATRKGETVVAVSAAGNGYAGQAGGLGVLREARGGGWVSGQRVGGVRGGDCRGCGVWVVGGDRDDAERGGGAGDDQADEWQRGTLLAGHGGGHGGIPPGRGGVRLGLFGSRLRSGGIERWPGSVSGGYRVG